MSLLEYSRDMSVEGMIFSMIFKGDWFDVQKSLTSFRLMSKYDIFSQMKDLEAKASVRDNSI